MLQMRTGTLYCMRLTISSAIIFASLFAQPAQALIFGEIVVNSKVGEPLLAHVPIAPESPNEKITTTCLSIIGSGRVHDQQKANLFGTKLTLEGDANTDRQIRITTTERVTSRALTLRLKANCVSNGLVIREFNLELETAAPPTLHMIESVSTPEKNEVTTTVQKTDDGNFMQQLDLNGSVRAGYFSSSRKLDGKSNLGSGSLWLKATQNFRNEAALVAQGWLRNDETFRTSAGSQKLQEGYLKFSAGNADYRIGKQIIVWGRADRLNPTDNLTPRNFTLLTPEDDDQRMGSLAAKLTYHSQENALTGIYLPGMDPNIFPVAVTPGIFFTEHIPHANQIAVKFDQSGKDVDWSASYFSGLDMNPDIAIGTTTLAGTNLILEHNRIRVLGMDAATVVGRYGLRAEAAYTWTENGGSNDALIKKPFLYMVMGGDRTFFDYLNINLQYYLRHVTNYTDPLSITDPVLRSVAIQGAVLSNQLNRFQHGVSVRVSNKWLNETLEGEIAAITSIGRSNYFIRPKLVYAFNDNIKGTLGLDIYRGESNTFFGQLRKSSLLFAEMKYGF